MTALSAWLRRRRWWVVVLWALAVAAALPPAGRQSDELVAGGFVAPGTQSHAVREQLENGFAQREELILVVAPDPGSARSTRLGELDRLFEQLAAVGSVEVVGEHAAAREDLMAGRTALVRLRVPAGAQAAPDAARDLWDRLDAYGGRRPGLRLHVIGRGAFEAALQRISRERVARAERIGFPLVLVVLLLIFGSLAAAGLPLLLGACAVVISGALIYLLAQVTLMSAYAASMASLLGIGVAVDYSMFMLVRYREELAAGADRPEALSRTMQTSGVAIVFSGLAVIASLAGLLLIEAAVLRSMAAGAMIVVAVAVLAAVTLLPALITLLGGRLRRRTGAAPAGGAGTFWARWSAAVMRRPLLSAVAAASALAVLALPALDVRARGETLAQFPADDATRVGYERAAAVQGPGAVSPVYVLVRPPTAADRVRAALAADPGIRSVAAPRRGGQPRAALLVAVGRHDPASQEAHDLIPRLRRDLPAAAPRAQVAIGGATAASIDLTDRIVGGLWKVALFVVLSSVVLLTWQLRSLVLPLKAALMNLLSVGAGFGVVVATFQWGWLEPIGFEGKGFVSNFTLPIVLALVFGLSMDYEIFLLSRIRERYRRHGDSSRAVAEALAHSARPITGAALIMVGVFATFVATGLPAVQELGLGLAVAIALDATLVRLILVPALMQLLGRWNWWLPGAR